MSECYLALTKDDLLNCENLTGQVRELQAGLMAASHVTVGGSSFAQEEKEEEGVLKIVRLEDDPAVNKTRRRAWKLRRSAPATLRIPECRVPAGVRVTVLFSEAGQLQGKVRLFLFSKIINKILNFC